MTGEGFERKGLQMPEVSEELVDRVRQKFVNELRQFSESNVHPEWKESALQLITDLEARKAVQVGGRIFPEFLDGAIEDSGVKLYSPEYQEIRRRLETPGNSR